MSYNRQSFQSVILRDQLTAMDDQCAKADFVNTEISDNCAEFIGKYTDKGIWTYGAVPGGIRDASGYAVYLFKLHNTGKKAFHMGTGVGNAAIGSLTFYFYTDDSMSKDKLTPAYDSSNTDWYNSTYQFGSNSGGASYYTIPDDAEYVAFSMSAGSAFEDFVDLNGLPELMIAEHRYPYTAYGSVVKKDKLINKRISWYGDSIMAGLYCDSTMSAKMDEMYETISRNHAISNTTFYGGGIVGQISNAWSEEPDVVIFDGGANDTNAVRFEDGISAWGKAPGSIANEAPNLTATYSTETVCGAFENFVQTIRNKWPTTKIVFVATHYIGANHPYADQHDCFEAFETACKKWAVQIVDMHNCGNINSYLDDSFTSNGTAPDKTHPSDATHYKYYIPMIANKLREILPD